MRHRLEIQRVTETPANSFGEAAETWITVAHRWGEIMPLQGRDALLAAQVSPDVTHKIRLRHLPELTSKDRIKYGARIFHLEPPTNTDERNRETIILAKEASV